MLQIKIAAGILAAVFILGGVFFILRLTEVTISKVEVTGTTVSDAALVQQIAEAELSESYAFLIPKRNTLFVPAGSIEENITGSFPIIKEAHVTHTSLTSISVSVVERTPSALWCTPFSESVAEECYAMDENGFIYMVAPVSDSYVRYGGEVEHDPVGSVYLSGGFRALGVFIGETAKALERTPVSVLVEKNKDVSVRFAGGGELKFVMSEDTTGTLENIASVFASQKLKGRTDFEYADFRFGNKIYVKFNE
jgi:hypothetical protein